MTSLASEEPTDITEAKLEPELGAQTDELDGVEDLSCKVGQITCCIAAAMYKGRLSVEVVDDPINSQNMR
eukprot:87465-Amphidinium_carterae.1